MATDQTGFTLATTMVFLVILTIVGITAMRNSTMELSMSSNMQDQNHAFQLAETAIARTAAETKVLDTRSTISSTVSFDYTPVFSSDMGKAVKTVKAESYYRGEGIPRRKSMEEINSLHSTSLHVFQINAFAHYNNATTTHIQGLTIMGPKSR